MYISLHQIRKDTITIKKGNAMKLGKYKVLIKIESFINVLFNCEDTGNIFWIKDNNFPHKVFDTQIRISSKEEFVKEVFKIIQT